MGGTPRQQNLEDYQTTHSSLVNQFHLEQWFQNGVECISGVLVVQDVIQNSESQAQKAYHGDLSSLPDKSTITVHTAEVLRLVKNAGIPNRGWVGGDSWFGSVTTAVEVTYITIVAHPLL